MRKYAKIFPIALLVLTFVACNEDTPEVLEVPETYTFEREGATSVNYSGQTERLEQLKQIKTKMNAGNAGTELSGQDLLDMFANTGGDGNGNFSFTSTKQIKDKTFAADQSYFESLMTAMGTASEDGADGVMASDGVAGLVTRGSSTILVNEKGHEFVQLIEKGIMGATFYHQMLSVYLTDDRVGDAVENTVLVDGQNYTSMEHHWDEAFGYLGVPVDFSSDWPSDRNSECVFWGNYTRGRDALLGSSDIIMSAFKTGRAAISAQMYDVKNEQRDIIYDELERICAATAIHYINSALANTTDNGEFFHALSELYAFIKALRYSPRASFTDAEITQLLKDISDEDFNFWNTTTTGLNEAKTKISTKFALDALKDLL
jgi:hypothetical protein